MNTLEPLALCVAGDDRPWHSKDHGVQCSACGCDLTEEVGGLLARDKRREQVARILERIRDRIGTSGIESEWATEALVLLDGDDYTPPAAVAARAGTPEEPK